MSAATQPVNTEDEERAMDTLFSSLDSTHEALRSQSSRLVTAGPAEKQEVRSDA